MKFISSLFIVCVLILLTGCKKQSSNGLPDITQYGANTFGCLINGQVFTPGGGGGTFAPHVSTLSSSYNDLQNLGFTFGIEGLNESNSCNISSVSINFDSVLMQVRTYKLQTIKAGQGEGFYSHVSNCNTGGYFETNDSLTGELTLTRFDSIASGTFWFNVLDQNHDTVKITSGRFDIHVNYSN